MEFDPENPILPALQITDPDEAKFYLGHYAYWKSMQPYDSSISNQRGYPYIELDLQAIEDARSNIGYLAGYNYTNREQIEEMYNCEHPVFGKFKEMGKPTEDEALQCGYQRKTLKELRSGK